MICGSLAAEKANVAAHKSNPNGICIFAIELNRSGSEMRDALRGDYILKEFYEEVHDDKPPVVFHCAKLICQPYHRGSVIRYVREQWTSKQKRTWPRQYLRVPRKKQIQQTSSSNGNDGSEGIPACEQGESDMKELLHRHIIVSAEFKPHVDRVLGNLPRKLNLHPRTSPPAWVPVNLLGTQWIHFGETVSGFDRELAHVW